ncbi:MAG: hypothetical protein KGV46_03605 [Pasteurella sp.]|nr:hypothetical protein [Pasteurella sp.]
MARDKAKDDKFFRCDEEHEHDYVVSLYSSQQQDRVSELLNDACKNNDIHYSKHIEVYKFIEKELGFSIPE